MSDNRILPGVRVGEHSYVWKREVSSVATAHTRGHSRARSVVAVASVLLGIFFLVLFGGFMSSIDPALMLDGAFWLTPQSSIAFLPFGLLLFCFAFFTYRLSREEHEKLPFGAGEFQEAVSLKEGRDIAEFADQGAVKVVEDAFALAEKNGNADVGPSHLFVSALASASGQILMARLGLTVDGVRDPLRRHLSQEPKGETVFGERGAALLAHAFSLAASRGSAALGSIDIFLAACDSDPFFFEFFSDNGIPPAELKNAVEWIIITDALQERYGAHRRASAFKPTGNMNRAMTAIATPFLDSVSEDLTRASVYGHTELLIGREDDVAALFRAIEGGNTSVVLVGQAGVGKFALIEGIADLMVEERVPALLQDKRLVKLSVPHIVSAQGGRGAEERLLYALREVGASGNIILVIENIHELVGTGSTGIDLSSILASELEKGYTFVIATTTPQAYTDVLERSVLGKRLERIAILEPERDLAIRIVESKAPFIEAKHKVVFTYGALAAAVDLARRYLHDTALPENAIAILKEAGLEGSKRGGGKMTWVSKEDIAALVQEKTKIPVSAVTENESEKLLSLEAKLHERVIGQEQAVTAVSAALRRARTEMRSQGKPIANFLFLGPTGVGKTELAKATSEVYFGNEQAMVRFDMSEYQRGESVTRLIGGNGESGLLTEAIRRNPFSLLLLDELEKAHPDILNIFLQVMDDGRLTDGLGQTVDFTNVILIATSNAGTQYIQDEGAKGTALATIKESLLATELRSLFRPEFLNRFTDVIVFSPLTEADVTAIAYLLVEKVKKNVAAKGMTLEVTDEAIHELGKQGFDPKFGARPLKRVIEEKLESALADELLKGNLGRRDTVIFDVGGKITIKKAEKL